MILGDFATLDLNQAEVKQYDSIMEISQRTSGGVGRLKKSVYPRSQFGYSNYQVDPRPDVLKLGRWVHPSTGNTLLGGINLNYLSARQIAELKRIAKQVFGRGTLRSRYRYVKRKMPEIAQYYRTYDEEYIQAEQPDEFKDFDYRDVKEPDKKDLAAKRSADADTVSDVSAELEPEREPEDEDDAVEAGREAWQAKRRLYNPDTGRRAKPEQDKVSDVVKSKTEKRNRYRSQRRKLRDLQNQAELARLTDRIKRDADELEPPEQELPKQSELGPYESVSADDYFYSEELGFVWRSSESYIRNHGPDRFRLIREYGAGRSLAVHDVLSGATVYDRAPDFIHVLQEAGWSYFHTILLERDGDELVITSDVAGDALMEAVGNLDCSKIVQVLSE